MRVLGLIVVLGLALGLGACGDDSSSASGVDAAGRAAQKVFEAYISGDAGQAWDTLHPAYQAIVARDTYINCEAGKTHPWTKVEIISEHDEIWDAPELGQQHTRAVELRLVGDQDIQPGTVHMLNVDGTWRWLLTQSVTDAFKQGKCT